MRANITYISGDYVLDPDGVQGESPFTVNCDMTDKEGIGVTVLTPDDENRTLVVGYIKKNWKLPT